VGKSKYSDKEYTKEQRLVHENQQLKKKIAHLRKLLARVDLDRADLKEAIEDSSKQEYVKEGESIMDRLKQEWKCKQCPDGYLEITLFNKINDTWYYRRCNSCSNRTKTQKYSSDVKGIIKEN